MTHLTDLELVEEAKKGNREAFNRLMERYREKVYWVVRRFLHDHDDADDVVQTVFVKVWRSLDSFKGKSAVFTWLYRIAVNYSLNEVKRQKLHQLFSLDEAADVPGEQYLRPDEKLEREEQTARIRAAVDQLPELQQKVFILRYYEELSYEEIGKILKKKEGTLKASYFFAVKKLGVILRDET